MAVGCSGCLHHGLHHKSASTLKRTAEQEVEREADADQALPDARRRNRPSSGPGPSKIKGPRPRGG